MVRQAAKLVYLKAKHELTLLGPADLQIISQAYSRQTLLNPNTLVQLELFSKCFGLTFSSESMPER